MSSNNKKGKKGKKKKSKKGKKKMSTEEEVDIVKKMYEEQMRAERLKELTQENEKLIDLAKELRVRLDRTEHVRNLMTVFLKNKVEGLQGDNKKMDLTNKELEARAKAEREEHEILIKSLQEDFQHDLADKETERSNLAAKYEELAKYVDERAQLMADLEEAKKTLEDERKKHQEDVDTLDRRNMQQTEWLKNELVEKIKVTKLSLLDMTEDQLHTTTKVTIMENEAKKTELEYQSKRAEQIVRRNQELEAKNRELRRKLSLSDDAQTMLAKRTQFFQKYIKKLTEKLAQAERQQVASVGAVPGTRSLVMDSKRKPSNELVNRLQAELQQQIETTEQLSIDNQRLQEQLAGAQSASRRIIALQDETTAFILTCMEEIKELQAQSKVKSGHAIIADIEHDSKHKMGKWHVGMPVPSSIDRLSHEERLEILELLLQKLSYYETSRLGRGPVLAEAPPALEAVPSRSAGILPSISRGASRGS